MPEAGWKCEAVQVLWTALCRVSAFVRCATKDRVQRRTRRWSAGLATLLSGGLTGVNEEHSIGGGRPQRKFAGGERPGAGTGDRIRWNGAGREVRVMNEGLGDRGRENGLGGGVGGRLKRGGRGSLPRVR